jgi:hypothetical protein
MLYAGSSWSELPISTSPQQESSGEEFGYEFTIDEFFEISGDIDGTKSFSLYICENPSFSVTIVREVSNLLELEQQQEFTLRIDDDNTWNLS